MSLLATDAGGSAAAAAGEEGSAVRPVRGLISGDLPIAGLEEEAAVGVGLPTDHLEAALKPTMEPPLPPGRSGSLSRRGSGESALENPGGVAFLALVAADEVPRDGGVNSVAVGDVKFPASPVDLYIRQRCLLVI